MQDQASRSEAAFPPAPAPPTSTTLQDEQFRFGGIDARLVHHWGRGNAFTVGVTGYESDAPFRQWSTPDLRVD